MNFDFFDDQRLLQDAVRTMLAETSTSQAVREVLEGRATHCDAVWRNLIDMGASAAAIPEQYGGSGLGYLALCLVAEEAGRHLAAVDVHRMAQRRFKVFRPEQIKRRQAVRGLAA